MSESKSACGVDAAELGGVAAVVDSMPPGVGLAAVLAGVDFGGLSSGDLFVVLEAQYRQVSFEQARLLEWLVVAAREGYHRADCARGDSCGCGARRPAGGGLGEFAEALIGFHLRWSRQTAGYQVGVADVLVRRLPAVWDALRSGVIDVDKACVYCSVLGGLSDEVVALVVAKTLPAAGRITVEQLRGRLRYWVLKADPGSARGRYRESVAGRLVSLRLDDDGTGCIVARGLPPDRAAAAMDRLHRLARAAKSRGDWRTLRQLETDAMLDLLTGAPFTLAPIPPVSASDPSGSADTGGPGSQNGHGGDEPAADVATMLAALRAHQHRTRTGHTPPGHTLDHPTPAITTDGDGDDGAAAATDETLWLGELVEPAQPPDPGESYQYSDAEQHHADTRLCPDTRPGHTSADDYQPIGAAGFFDHDPLPARHPDGHLDLTRTPTPDHADQCVCQRIIPAPRRGVVDIHLSLATLLAANNDPATIPGLGPILADIARDIAADPTTQHRYSIIGPDGQLLHHSTPRQRNTRHRNDPPQGNKTHHTNRPRQPTTATTAFIHSRDKTCRAPGCEQPATRNDLDHTTPWSHGGTNDATNCISLCRHHHRLKHEKGFTITKTSDGTHHWQAPNGHNYPSPPHPDLHLLSHTDNLCPSNEDGGQPHPAAGPP